MAGIYIHIPFCRQACNYCNFHFSTSLKLKADMLLAISRELSKRTDYLGTAAIRTIYFGGGTPSLLQADELLAIFDLIYQHYPNIEQEEITLEANPDDLTTAYLKALARTPVNRLSIGIQSFRDEDLKYMHRAHDARQADYSVKAAQDAGFSNLSIDLIYGTPGLDNAHWKENIRKAVGLRIPHIAAYALTVEPKTALSAAIEKGKSQQVSSRQSADQFELLMDEMENYGYEHYEISNFARPGGYAIHNTSYWQGAHYLGIGPSAHSFNGHSRQWNCANNAAYISGLLKEDKLLFETEQLSDKDQLNEYIMTSLRTMWGLDLQYITRRYGAEAKDQILQAAEAYLKQGKMINGNDCLILTGKGKLFADGIASALFF